MWGVHEKLPVQQAQDDDAHHAHGDHRLEVLQPKLVLHGRGLLLELSAAILEGICALLESSELGVTVQPFQIKQYTNYNTSLRVFIESNKT